MVEPTQLSADLASTIIPAFPVQERHSGAGTNSPSEIQDKVTLSRAALLASSSSNLRVFPPVNAVVVAQNELAALVAEFPLEELLVRGYSAAQIAVALGLPAEIVETDLGIQTFHTAA